MSIPTLQGITPKTITTGRITTRVLFRGPESGIPVFFLHGNTSSATWWEETMVALPKDYYAIAPDQRGFGDADPEKYIDATQGMGDLAQDVIALLDFLGIVKAHIVGNSLGGNVVWRMLADHPERFLSVTLADPGSPYGYGATRDTEGTPTTPDFSGSGAGISNPEAMQRMIDGDRSTESQFSPRSVFRTLVVKPPFIPEREEEILSALLATHFGDKDQPGDLVQSDNWPFVAPGVWGARNALSPKYIVDAEVIINSQPKSKILWVRGSHSLIISDEASIDLGYLGKIGLIPGWPGEEIYPPQPMVSQTRAVLDKYAAAGGSYEEVVIHDAGHIPFIEKPDEFNTVFHAHLMK